MRIVLLVAAALLVAAGASPVSIGTLSAAKSPKTIALSFDDSPRGPGAFMSVEQRNLRLVAALRQAGVDQAVFFANPGRITTDDGDAARLDRYAAAGHVLANHSFTHPSLSHTAPQAFVQDIARADRWLRPRPGFRPWFRFPALDEGGPDKPRRDFVRAALRRMGLSNGYATVDGSDWHIEGMTIAARRDGKPMDMAALRDLYVETHVQSADFSDELMQRTLGRRPAQMLLLHETDLAALFVGDLVAALRKDGWTIVTADQAFADPVYRSQPDVPWTNGTLAEQLAWAKKLPPPRWYDRNNEKISRGLFVESVLHGAKAPVPPPRPDGAALTKAAGLPHIPIALRGCWQGATAADRLTIGYVALTFATPARVAMADSVQHVAPRRIDGIFLGPDRKAIARAITLGPDASGVPAGQLRLSGGGMGARSFVRCS